MRKILPLFLLLACSVANAQQKSPDLFPQKVKVLKRFLDKYHYQPRIWNDSASALLYRHWIEILDDDKLLFTQKDMVALSAYQYKLDDELQGNGWGFFNLSVSLYQAKLKKADSLISQVLAKPIDLTRSDAVSWPFAAYAANDQELALRWQQFLKWQVLGTIVDDMVSAKRELPPTLPTDFSTLETAARQKRKKAQLNQIRNLLKTPAELLQSMQDDYLNAISWSYDPHSSYMDLSEKKEWDAATSASEFSAGLDLSVNEKEEVVISFLQPGGSAWRSGQLHTGDVLVKVKTGAKEKTVEEMSAEELENLLSGDSEADLEVTVRTASGEIKTVKLHKEKISDDESIVKSYVLHGQKNIGYISLPGFYSREEEGQTDAQYDGCANDVSKEIVKLKKDNIDGLILDLRYNGGGSMWEGMQLAGIFIDIGPIASLKDRDGKVHFLKDPNHGTVYDGPLMVLVNGASASASEFVSAALQDYNRALIVGGTTYGKGTAQVVLPMDTGTISKNGNYTDFVKVTENKFYRVNGSTTQWKGVEPDIVLPDIYAGDSYKEKSNASALQPDNSKEGIYRPLPALPVAQLKASARQRISGDEYFTNIESVGEWITKYKTGRTVPLQWNSYVAYYKNTMSMFDKLSDEKEKTLISVTNNNFDQQQVNQSTEQSKMINATYLKHISADHTVAEAYKIMLDWTK
ncbi:carboxy terminal-processing peptidase [Ferruginibacter sp. HRS2-29]|uniref:carboxy terminal-processing peptidase n=1 Tax=Ferruginibacter sp. HRS2-29 TaxID=2487334 RepID=UPI0020CB8D41|nr:carboxy terminal-processing peptidase [Ferruginibacter sp. HRS2-29]MCP9749754.1 hypothetical protein [Ferruginibacter sp. HRS2-29]